MITLSYHDTTVLVADQEQRLLWSSWVERPGDGIAHSEPSLVPAGWLGIGRLVFMAGFKHSPQSRITVAGGVVDTALAVAATEELFLAVAPLQPGAVRVDERVDDTLVAQHKFLIPAF